jgi:single-stranded DNA-binding protein
MQEAVVERNGKDGEKEIIVKAKEIAEKILEGDKDLQEIRAKYPNGQDGGAAPVAQAATPTKPSKPTKPAPNFSDMDDDVPF